LRVHLYLATGEADLAALAATDQVLDAPERTRAARFVMPADQQMYRAAHVLLRRALSRHAPVDPAAWRFGEGAHGRPQIAAPSAGTGLHFSLAHTHGLACCAVAETVAVGIDAEGNRALGDALDLAQRFFAPAEAATLAALPPPERMPHFYALWTLKEGFVKALGLGLSAGLDRCAFRLAAGTPGTITLTLYPPRDDGAADHWRCVLLRIDGSYTLAACVRAAAGARFCVHPLSPADRSPRIVLSASSAGARHAGPII
jgi:4'-phosphopantetheinyl transferase